MEPLMPMMKAVALTRYLPISDPESLIDLELPQPLAKGHDLLVRVEAVSVNPVDTKVRAPKDKVEQTPRVLGYDAAGVVEAVGEAVTLFQPGDRVYYAGDITRPGTNSQFHLVDERIVGPMPATLDFAAAAALPLTGITAWEALRNRLRIDPKGGNRDESILIIGGAGGVGSMAIQLARLAGLKVIATASRPESGAWVRELGAAHVIDHRGDMPAQCKALGLEYVEHILCLNATDLHWPAMAALVAPQGMICSIVESPVPLNLELLKSKSAGFVWEFMFTRSMYQTPDMIEQHRLLAQVKNLVDKGELRATAKESLGRINAANLRRAHAQLESGATIGKVVLAGW
jgi:NADPH2:quinone reductase